MPFASYLPYTCKYIFSILLKNNVEGCIIILKGGDSMKIEWALDQVNAVYNKIESGEITLKKLSNHTYEPSLELYNIYGALLHNLRFEPKKVSYYSIRNAAEELKKYQSDYGVDFGKCIAELDEYLKSHEPKEKTEFNLKSVRKQFIGKRIFLDRLKNCEDVRNAAGEITFYYYWSDTIDEYIDSILLNVDNNMIITSISAIYAEKLSYDSAYCSQYKKCQSNNDHYSELADKLYDAVE